MNSVKRLIESGLTNRTIGFTLGEITQKSYSYSGKCTSVIGHEPCGFTTTRKASDNCPKCGHALYWDKKRVDV